MNETPDKFEADLQRFVAWCHDHGKLVAVVVALLLGVIVGFWAR